MTRHKRNTTIKYYNGTITPGVFTWQGIKKIGEDHNNDDDCGSDSDDEHHHRHNDKHHHNDKHRGVYNILGNLTKQEGVLYTGGIDGKGKKVAVVFPGNNIVSTSVYSSDLHDDGRITLVGSYVTTAGLTKGLLFKGTFKEIKNPKTASYRTIHTGTNHTFVHSVANGLAVGNCDDVLQHGTHNLEFGPITAFLYNIKTGKSVPIIYPGAISNTAYGIVHNGGCSYTICGGHSNKPFGSPEKEGNAFYLPIGEAFIVDYNSDTGCFSNWTSFCYPGKDNLITHFQGISKTEHGVYQLCADSINRKNERNTSGDKFKSYASWVEIHRHREWKNPCGDSLYCHKKKDHCHNEFTVTRWIDISYPKDKRERKCGNGAPCKSEKCKVITSANSVSGNVIVGVALVDGKVTPFQAVIDFARKRYVNIRRWRHCVDPCDRECWDPRWRYDECNRRDNCANYSPCGGNIWRWNSCNWGRDDVRWRNYDFGCPDWWWDSCDRRRDHCHKRRHCKKDCSDSDSSDSDCSDSDSDCYDDWSSCDEDDRCDLVCDRNDHCEGKWQERHGERQWISNVWRWDELNWCKTYRRRCRKSDREWLKEGCHKLGSRHDHGYSHRNNVVVVEARRRGCECIGTCFGDHRCKGWSC